MSIEQRTRRFRFTLKQLFLAVALIAVGPGVWTWLFRKVVEVRAATSEDALEDNRLLSGDSRPLFDGAPEGGPP